MKAVIRAESWPIRGGFRIARGARTSAEVLVLELRQEAAVGRAECVPYPRYGESIDSVRSTIEAFLPSLGTVEPREARQQVQKMAPGAARNALDCALWDLDAKRAGAPAWSLAGLRSPPGPVSTMRTVSVASPADMKRATAALDDPKAVKVKVDGGPDLDRIAAVHEAAPFAKLIVDANESWSAEQTEAWLPELPGLGVALLEQPLRANEDIALETLARAVPVCADESFHDRSSFPQVAGRYDAINIKLDKAGGLTEALACKAEAEQRGLSVMIGCMVSTSLAIEPALLLTERVAYVDLDGPLLLEHDRQGANHDQNASLLRASPSLWGAA